MERLSDEAIDKLPKIMTTQPTPRPSAVAQEAHQNALRQVVEWIKGKRETPLGPDAYGYYIWEAALQDLKKEAEGR